MFKLVFSTFTCTQQRISKGRTDKTFFTHIFCPLTFPPRSNNGSEALVVTGAISLKYTHRKYSAVAGNKVDAMLTFFFFVFTPVCFVLVCFLCVICCQSVLTLNEPCPCLAFSHPVSVRLNEHFCQSLNGFSTKK